MSAQVASERIELVAELAGSMPSGVTVASSGRIFVCFPRWVDRVPYTVGELHPDGTVSPFPDARCNQIDFFDPSHHFASVQSVDAGEDGTLWILDTGRPYFLPALEGAAKLVQVDIASGAWLRTYVIPHGIARRRTYLNDVRIAKSIGAAGSAFITDSSTLGPGALIVVDLATGNKMRRLDNHASVNPDVAVLPIIEGEPLEIRLPFNLKFPFRYGADGIALSADERTLYYCPLTSRRLYAVDARTLADANQGDDSVARTIQDLGQKAVSDGLECDASGNVYATDIENRQILVRSLNGVWNQFACNDRMWWTDTLCIAGDGFMYFTANQVHRMWPFHRGIDRRKKPYAIFRVRLEAS